MGKQSKKAMVVGHITLAEPSTVAEYVRREKEYLYAAIDAGYAEASRRQTNHLDSGTLDALYVEERIDRWAELSSDELYDLEEITRPDNYWAGEVLYALARIKAQQERAAREAKALARARREQERRKPLTHCPFAVALGK